MHEAAAEKQDFIAALVRDAMSRIKDQWQDGALVTIKAHPQDVPVLEKVREQLNQDTDAPANLRIEADPSVSAGGCRVETATRVVDATLEAQLVRLGEALKRRSIRAATCSVLSSIGRRDADTTDVKRWLFTVATWEK